MVKELDLKAIDSKEKAFLIGATSSHLIKYWKVSKELLAKNILRIEWCLASFNDDSFKGENQKEIIKNWFIRNFGDYIDKIEITPNKFGNENWWINIYFRITEDSKNNIEKYIPVKKDLYDYYIRGMFGSFSFRKNFSASYTSTNYPFCIIGNNDFLKTLSKKLNDYYKLTEYHLHIDNSPKKFGYLSYLKNKENTEYFNSVFEKTQDLFDFEF